MDTKEPVSATGKEEPVTKMRKAIRLRMTLWIEGEDEPAHNFAESTIQAVKEVIEAGSTKHPELKFTIKKISE